MSDKEKQERMVELYALVSQAKELLAEAEAFADKHGLNFVWNQDYGNPKQQYLGKGFETQQFDYKTGGLKTIVIEEGRWVSSSDGC